MSVGLRLRGVRSCSLTLFCSAEHFCHNSHSRCLSSASHSIHVHKRTYPWLSNLKLSSRYPEKQVTVPSVYYQTVNFEGQIITSWEHPLSSHPEFFDLPEKPVDENSVGYRVKLLAKQYGTLALVFHTSISLAWLGATYVLVSYGLDVAALTKTLGLTSNSLQAKLASGASTFVIAYSVHKCFALVRLSITAATVPILVRYFRKVGLMTKLPASGAS